MQGTGRAHVQTHIEKKKKEAAWSMIFISKIKSALRQNQKVEFIPQI